MTAALPENIASRENFSTTSWLLAHRLGCVVARLYWESEVAGREQRVDTHGRDDLCEGYSRTSERLPAVFSQISSIGKTKKKADTSPPLNNPTPLLVNCASALRHASPIRVSGG